MFNLANMLFEYNDFCLDGAKQAIVHSCGVIADMAMDGDASIDIKHLSKMVVDGAVQYLSSNEMSNAAAVIDDIIVKVQNEVKFRVDVALHSTTDNQWTVKIVPTFVG